MTTCNFPFYSMSSLLIFKLECLKWQFRTNDHILVKNTIELIYERMTQPIWASLVLWGECLWAFLKEILPSVPQCSQCSSLGSWGKPSGTFCVVSRCPFPHRECLALLLPQTQGWAGWTWGHSGAAFRKRCGWALQRHLCEELRCHSERHSSIIFNKASIVVLRDHVIL